MAKEGARLAGGYKIRWGPPCLQFVPFPSLLQAEAGEFIPSIAAWFIAVLAQRSHKTTGEIIPGVMTVPGLGRCPEALGSELVWEGRLQPWRSSHVEEHPVAAWVFCWKHMEPLGFKLPPSTSHPCLLPDFQFPCACCQPSEAPWALVGCSCRQAEPQAGCIPASRFLAGIWIVSSSLLPRSTCRFPSCLTGRLWEGQAVMAELVSPPLHVGTAVGNAL